VATEKFIACCEFNQKVLQKSVITIEARGVIGAISLCSMDGLHYSVPICYFFGN
jgi:hypothetical protein